MIQAVKHLDEYDTDPRFQATVVSSEPVAQTAGSIQVLKAAT